MKKISYNRSMEAIECYSVKTLKNPVLIAPTLRRSITIPFCAVSAASSQAIIAAEDLNMIRSAACP